MYIEEWQILMLLMVGATAWFSYREGLKAGVQNGIQFVISDLHQNNIVSVRSDKENGEITVGRYDE